MSILVVSFLSASIVTGGQTELVNHEYKIEYPSRSECIRGKQEQVKLLEHLNQDSILGYSVKCEG